MGCIKSKYSNNYQIINNNYTYIYVEDICDLKIKVKIINKYLNKYFNCNKKIYYLEFNNLILPDINYGVCKSQSMIINNLQNILNKLLLNTILKIQIIKKYNNIIIADVWRNGIYFNNYLLNKRLVVHVNNNILLDREIYNKYGYVISY
jgi:hypothetical protein